MDSTNSQSPRKKLAINIISGQERNCLSCATSREMRKRHLVQIGSQFPIQNVPIIEGEGRALALAFWCIFGLSQNPSALALDMLQAQVGPFSRLIQARFDDAPILFARIS